MKLQHLICLSLCILLLHVAACSSDNTDLVVDVSEFSTELEEVDDEPADSTNEANTEQDAKTDNSRLPINKDTSFVVFEGFSKDSSHTGSFENASGYFHYDNEGNLEQIEAVIDAASVKTPIFMLTNHLKEKDFFDVETFPEIHVKSTSINLIDSTITGEIKFKGETVEITFPAKITSDSVESSIELDMSHFDFSQRIDKVIVNVSAFV